MTGRRRPLARCGSSSRPNTRTAWAFCSRGRARSIVPRMLARRAINGRRPSVTSAPAPRPTTTIRPSMATARRLSGKCGAPTSSRMTSAPRPSVASSTLSAKPWSVIGSPPSSRTRAAASALRTVPSTRAPQTPPICRAALPTPPAAPWTSSVSPVLRPAWVRIASCAVMNASGTAAAPGSSSASGTAATWRSCTTTRSASPPPPTRPKTRSPGFQSSTCAPQVSTVPATSSPGMSCGLPGGAG